MMKILTEGNPKMKTTDQTKSAKELLVKKLLTPPGFPSKGYDSDKVRRIVESFEWYILRHHNHLYTQLSPFGERTK
jgi:hypothetical protein